MEDFTDLVEDKSGLFDYALKAFGFRPKEHYTFEALWELEELINEKYPEGHEPMPTTLLPFGQYLLKTLEKNLSGSKVNAKVETVWDILIEFEKKGGGEMMIFPFRRADKFWRNREDSMAAMLEMMLFLVENDAFSPEIQKLADPEGWITLPKGSVFRLFQATKEQAEEIMKREK